MKILFVCLGNICRSPAAEGVLKTLWVNQSESAADRVFVDSAGTSNYHKGAAADERMQRAALRRGYRLTSRARQVTRQDFVDFDWILAMDRDNYDNLARLRDNFSGKAQLKLFGDFCEHTPGGDVPDPYHGGLSGFETVLDILEDGCLQIVSMLEEQLNPQ